MINKEKLFNAVCSVWMKKGVEIEKECVKDMIWEVIEDMIESGYSRNEILHYFKTHRPPKCYR